MSKVDKLSRLYDEFNKTYGWKSKEEIDRVIKGKEVYLKKLQKDTSEEGVKNSESKRKQLENLKGYAQYRDQIQKIREYKVVLQQKLETETKSRDEKLALCEETRVEYRKIRQQLADDSISEYRRSILLEDQNEIRAALEMRLQKYEKSESRVKDLQSKISKCDLAWRTLFVNKGWDEIQRRAANDVRYTRKIDAENRPLSNKANKERQAEVEDEKVNVIEQEIVQENQGEQVDIKAEAKPIVQEPKEKIVQENEEEQDGIAELEAMIQKSKQEIVQENQGEQVDIKAEAKPIVQEPRENVVRGNRGEQADIKAELEALMQESNDKIVRDNQKEKDDIKAELEALMRDPEPEIKSDEPIKVEPDYREEPKIEPPRRWTDQIETTDLVDTRSGPIVLLFNRIKNFFKNLFGIGLNRNEPANNYMDDIGYSQEDTPKIDKEDLGAKYAEALNNAEKFSENYEQPRRQDLDDRYMGEPQEKEIKEAEGENIKPKTQRENFMEGLNPENYEQPQRQDLDDKYVSEPQEKEIKEAEVENVEPKTQRENFMEGLKTENYGENDAFLNGLRMRVDAEYRNSVKAEKNERYIELHKIRPKTTEDNQIGD